MGSRELLEHRKPFEDLEAAILERHLAQPQDTAPSLLAALRYVVNFAKLTTVRDERGHDIDFMDQMSTHSWRVKQELERRLGPDESTLWAAARVLPELVAETRALRDRLDERLGLSREVIDREVCNRKLVLVLGGGGGAGYGYAGIFTLLHRHDLEPSLICGTSIGALIGLFRARSRQYDAALLLEANRALSWDQLFKLGPDASRYGLPATLRLYLRRGIGQFLERDDGSALRMRDLAIPMHIVATGLTVDALKHDLDYYEHFLDDVVKPGLVFRMSALARLGKLADIFRELTSNPQNLREVVFGLDPGTEDIDCLDAAGFSASVPGLLHYDVLRDDQRTEHLLDALYGRTGITRLTEGGVVNNVPARVGFKSAMAGRLDGHRNIYTIAVDCFPPRPRSLVFYPIQQIARQNVIRNIPYANVYLPLSRALNPINLVPNVEEVTRASRWAMEALDLHIGLAQATCQPFEPI